MAAFIAPVTARPSTLSPTAFHGSLLNGVAARCPRRRAIPHGARRTITHCKLDALIFDCDGVLADTERDAHRVAFNLAFADAGLRDTWDDAQYGHLLETGGGKERMTAYWDEVGWPQRVKNAQERLDLVRGLHKRKTELFMQLVRDGKCPLRPGVARLVGEARAADVPLAVCSTSNELAVAQIVAMLGTDVAAHIRIFAGDVVQHKKPSPDIYTLAQTQLGVVDARNVCVVEDSRIGLAAATAAGMPCVVTESTYTKGESFDHALSVLQSLDDPLTTLADLTAMVDAARTS